MPRNALAATILIPVHPAGWPFVGALAALAAALLFVGWGWALLAALAALATALFFRDPARHTPIRQGLIVSPADGRVIAVAPAVPPAELALTDRPLMRVSIFLSIFDVHINRAPVDGLVQRRIHTKGRFRNAAFVEKSEANERQCWLIAAEDGPPVVVVQIAGLIARRILGWVDEGARVRAGERIGMIRFGSRTDVYLPEGVVPLVAVGQKMIGGETVIADARANEPPRPASVR